MADTPHPQYEVISQSKTVEPDEQGNLKDQWRVHYQSPSGTKSYVDVPADYYTPRNVHDAIAHEMSTIEAVHGLGQGPPPPAHEAPGS
jgi:hypothetical protein